MSGGSLGAKVLSRSPRLDILDEDGAVQFAMEHNPELLRMRQNTEWADGEAKQRRSFLLPQLILESDVAGEQSRFPAAIERNLNSMGINLYVQQNLINRAARLRYESAKYQREATLRMERAAENQIAFLVRRQFIQVRQLDRTALAYRQRLREMEALLESVNEQVNRNVTSRQQRAELQNRIALRQAELEILERQRDVGRLEVLNLIGAPSGHSPRMIEALRTPFQAPVASRDGLVSAAVEGRPEIAAFELAVRAENEAARAVRAEFMPRVVLSSGLSSVVPFEEGDQASELVGGAAIRWTPMDSGSRKARNQQVNARIEQARIDLEDAKRTIAIEIDNVLVTAERAATRLQLTHEQHNAATEAFELYSESYQSGLDPLNRLVIALDALIESDVAVASAQADAEQANAAMQRALGRSAYPK